MKKKIIVLSLVIASIFFLAACSGGAKNDDISISVNEGEKVDLDEVLGFDPEKQVEYVDLEITEQHITEKSMASDWDFWVNEYKVKNTGNVPVKWILLQANCLDANGDIVEAPLYSDGSADGVTVNPGQSVTIAGNISKDKNIKTVELTSARYYVQESPDERVLVRGNLKNVQPLTVP